MIKLLDNALISQIAAGEVVERPLSVIRELVDNSVDAKSTFIEIEIEEGGQSLIRVQDNGSGIDPDQLELAVARHATSKINSISELESVLTKGFRGEALASITAVSKVIISSKQKNKVGKSYNVFKNTIQNETLADGTTVEVSGLYYNTPARKKFLKSPNFEQRKIKEWLIKYSLGHPNVTFKLVSDQKEVLNFFAVDTIFERAEQIYSGAGISVDFSDNGMRILGYLLKPDNTHTDTSQLTILVNDRLINDRSILQAVRLGFDSTLKYKEYPIGVINILIDANDVDVNVHPQKSEVRFKSADIVFRTVRLAILSAFNIKPIKLERENTYVPKSNFIPLNYEQNSLIEKSENPQGYFASVKFLAQIFNGFLLCERNNTFLIIDMHAAHERINFNKIRKILSERKILSQNLLIPQAVELSDLQIENLKTKDFSKLGFEIDYLPNSALVRSIPEILSKGDLSAIIKELSSSDFPNDIEDLFKTKVDEISARLACHASLRTGDIVNSYQVSTLLKQLDSEEFALSCPHGRSILKEFSRLEVEEWFGRD